MKRKATTLPIGSISYGTLHTEDLIDAFMYALDGLHLTRGHRAFIRSLSHKLTQWECADDDSALTAALSIDLDNALNEKLFDIMDCYCPPYTYFGTLEGDASDFGVWPNYDAIEDDLSFQDSEASLVNVENVTRGYSGYAVEVNDHGNMTLFSCKRGRRRIVWAIV